MKNKKILNGGYVGLIMLLVGVAIIAYLIVGTDLFTGQKEGKNMIEQGQDSINQAKAAKDMIEQNNTNSIQEL